MAGKDSSHEAKPRKVLLFYFYEIFPTIGT